MCIIFFIANTDNDLLSTAGYKLILASNRDEVYNRPAKAAAPWDNAKHVIGGKDMESGREGGTWLGLSALEDRIKIGALLNLPGETKLTDNAAGRGPLVANYLVGDSNNFDYSDGLFRSRAQFNAFNLVTIEFNESTKSVQILHTSNTPREIQDFPSGQVLGFSNSNWRVPLKKVDHGRDLFREIVSKPSQTKEELVDELMNLLANKQPFDNDAELQRRVERDARKTSFINFSSIYVSIPELNYGSRTKTVILIDKDNNLDFYERYLDEVGGVWTENHIRKQLFVD